MERLGFFTGCLFFAIISLTVTSSPSYAWPDQVQNGETGYKLSVAVGKAIGLPVGGEFDKNLPAPKKLWEIDTSAKPNSNYNKPNSNSNNSTSSSGPVKTIPK